jgi:Protein of unknown function (DUF3485)
MTSMSVRPLSKPSHDTARPAAGIVVSPWLWMAVTCLLLGLSGGIRYWRDWQFSSLSARSEVMPFSLNELPRKLQSWQAGEGAEAQLDPEVARFAGSVEHVVRGYLDEKTGDQASVLVLYGLAAKVFGHLPDVCYPAAGYRPVKGPIERTITVPGVDVPVRYRWAIYMKRADGVSRYEEAYCTFLHNGEWLPDASARWKSFRYYPGMFKIQIAHPVSTLTEDSDGPCLGLLGELVREVTARAYPAKSDRATASAPSTATSPPVEEGPG